MHVAEMTEGADTATLASGVKSLSAQLNVPDPVHVQLNARGYQTCEK